MPPRLGPTSLPCRFTFFDSHVTTLLISFALQLHAPTIAPNVNNTLPLPQHLNLFDLFALFFIHSTQ